MSRTTIILVIICTLVIAVGCVLIAYELHNPGDGQIIAPGAPSAPGAAQSVRA